MKQVLQIADRQCTLYTSEQPQVLLIQPVGEHEYATLDTEIDTICKSVHAPFVFIAFEIKDWEKELTPWHDSYVSKRQEVGEHAVETLDYILGHLMPYLYGNYGKLPVVLGGYSLAGLFARWAVTRADCFHAVAAASPSLWIAGWTEFSAAHDVCAGYVYLSLGDREEHTKNKAIAKVGENIRWEYEHLQQNLGSGHCTLVWEQGGHFANPYFRTARAFAWCINQLFERQ